MLLFKFFLINKTKNYIYNISPPFLPQFLTLIITHPSSSIASFSFFTLSPGITIFDSSSL
ncbi:hypothetical protein HanXRQr2_Chr13g0565691 [Helianthus annuus]|uniref:Uncharacterized protein n=1 Tax=Helianthus annuus TaxID=4232 RepID=A0A251SMM8_HELAN|nr:hypothetical protein HanXRQr2_Chr13g0565691 [Helianthus annuus]